MSSKIGRGTAGTVLFPPMPMADITNQIQGACQTSLIKFKVPIRNHS